MALSGSGFCSNSSLLALIAPRVTKIQPSGPMNCTPLGVFWPSPTTLRSVTVLSSRMLMVTPFGAVAPLGDVIVVRAPIGPLAAAEGIPPAEVPMAVLAVVRHHRRLSDIEIPIQPLGNRLLRKRAVDRSRGQTDDDVLEFAQASVADQFAGKPEVAVAALLAADLNNALVVAHRLHQAFAFVNGEGERFLAVDILAALHGTQVHKRVPVIGRAGDDDVDVIAFHELAKILVLLRRLAVLAELLAGSLGVAVVNVADGNHIAMPRRPATVAAALAAATDQGDAGTVVGTQRPGLRGVSLFEFHKPTRHAGGGRNGGSGLDETTTIDVENMWCHETNCTPESPDGQD